jgi:hypothetical protein
VELLDKGGEDFLYWISKFLNRSNTKVKEEIFVGPQIRRIMCNEDFRKKHKSTELALRENITLFFIDFVCNQNVEH